MYEQEIGMAMAQVRLGEMRTALGIITTAISSGVCHAQPMYSDILRMPLEKRRAQLAVALKCVASEFELVARKVLERCGPTQSQDDKKNG